MRVADEELVTLLKDGIAIELAVQFERLADPVGIFLVAARHEHSVIGWIGLHDQT